ncbi:hypothetical protein BGZ63DRAFT_366255 [Mariannaea sp. PMI_226]|nr:hypothetical protein BGZ63DRAFT_366255 [Mariannaea sp. PMI_226]
MQTGGHSNLTQPQADSPEIRSLTNPLSTGASVFMTSDSGRLYYLGVSSNWSFTRRIVNLAHEFVYKSALPSPGLIFDGETYDIEYETDTLPIDVNSASLPTQDYAIHLVNSVKFHCCQLFHLFDDDEFMGLLHEFYAEPERKAQVAKEKNLWYIHFLLILAFGKAFVSKRSRGKRPPGVEYFIQAMQLLPNTIVLTREPLQSTEVLCCIALYLQCLDHRISAYNFIGQAVRLAMSQGMHTNLSAQQLGDGVAQRYRRIWSTVHVLDREMTSLEGVPQSVNDEDVCTTLPPFLNDPTLAKALALRIKLSRVIANVNRSIYGSDGRLDSKFLLRTKEALPGIAELADELQQSFPLALHDTTIGISRQSAHIHLLYHQCIILATRPMLFCFFKIRLEDSQACRSLLDSSQTVRSLIHMCLDACQQIIIILESLQRQELLETFLIFDLEALSMATTNLLVAPTVILDLPPDCSICIRRAFAIFEELTASGNLIAELEQSELRQLDNLLSSVSSVSESSAEKQTYETQPDNQPPSYTEVLSADARPPPSTQNFSYEPLPDAVLGSNLHIDDFGSVLSPTQMLEIANAINIDQTEWISQAMEDYGVE